MAAAPSAPVGAFARAVAGLVATFVAGGGNASGSADLLLEKLAAGVAVSGDGDTAFLALGVMRGQYVFSVPPGEENRSFSYKVFDAEAALRHLGCHGAPAVGGPEADQGALEAYAAVLSLLTGCDASTLLLHRVRQQELAAGLEGALNVGGRLIRGLRTPTIVDALNGAVSAHGANVNLDSVLAGIVVDLVSELGEDGGLGAVVEHSLHTFLLPLLRSPDLARTLRLFRQPVVYAPVLGGGGAGGDVELLLMPRAGLAGLRGAEVAALLLAAAGSPARLVQARGCAREAWARRLARAAVLAAPGLAGQQAQALSNLTDRGVAAAVLESVTEAVVV